MITRYRVLTERLRSELQKLEQVVERAEAALSRAAQQPQDQVYFIAAAALDLHGFYAGIERRLLALIADEMDGGLPKGPRWHRDLLEQLSLEINEVRPAVLRSETQLALITYLEFRHVVRSVYTFNLQPERLKELVRDLRPTFDLVQRDLRDFARFLDALSDADETSDEN